MLFVTGGRPGPDRIPQDWMVHRMDLPGRPGRQPLPDLVRPMLAVPGELPDPTDDDAWAYELKWDGVRAVAYLEGGRVRLRSRNDLDLSRSYPEIQALGAAMGSMPTVLDGELVAPDATGRASFSRLQRRMQVTDAGTARGLAAQVPVVYLVFDLLHLDGRSTVALPYHARRELLEGLDLAGPSWQVPPSFPGPGSDVARAGREQGLEGVVAKLRDSPYRPGRRSPEWRKIKHVRMQAVVVVGWRPGAGRRGGGIGSLLLAVGGPDGPEFVGGVGTGFTQAMLADLEIRLSPLERSAPPVALGLTREAARDAHWVAPRLVGEVAFADWSPNGRLRHPTWRGLRPDIPPEHVVRES